MKRPRTYVGAALDEMYPERYEEDPDIAWVEREIQKCEDGPRSIFQDTPNLTRIRNERRDRLLRMKARMLGEEPTT